MIDACSDAVPISGCGGAAWSRRSSASSACSTRPMRRIASRPSRGRLPCAARPFVSTSNHAKPLWPIAIWRSVGSVTTAPSARHRVTSASAPILAYSSSTTAATISRPASRPASATSARRVDHRGDAALHVLRAAAVDPAVALHRIERRRHPFDADGVDVPAQHQRAPCAAPLEHADHVRRVPGRPPAFPRRARGAAGAWQSPRRSRLRRPRPARVTD